MAAASGQPAASDARGDLRAVSRLLKCRECAATAVTCSGEKLACRGCGASYAIVNGVIVLKRGEVRDDLHYAPPLLSRKRKLLRRFGLEAAARRLWHAYLALDRWTSVTGPSFPDYWMPRVLAGFPESVRAVLDFGGGSGWFRQHLPPDVLYSILEVDADSFDVRENREKWRYIIGDGHQPLFAANSFDVISMFEVLEHVRNPFKIFENCAEWLRPGGVLVLSTPQYWHVHGWPSDYFRYTIYGLKELAATSGLEVVDYWDMGGPCLLIWSALRLNFSVLDWPLVRQLVAIPLYLLAWLGDRTIFRNNLSRRNPDTRGWMLVARKPVTAAPAA